MVSRKVEDVRNLLTLFGEQKSWEWIGLSLQELINAFHLILVNMRVVNHVCIHVWFVTTDVSNHDTDRRMLDDVGHQSDRCIAGTLAHGVDQFFAADDGKLHFGSMTWSDDDLPLEFAVLHIEWRVPSSYYMAVEAWPIF